MACLQNFLKFQFQKIFFFICKITSQTRKHFSENQFQNPEICSIEEIESHLISKPERFFLNWANFRILKLNFRKVLLCLRSDFANKEKDFLKLEFEKISQTRHYIEDSIFIKKCCFCSTFFRSSFFSPPGAMPASRRDVGYTEFWWGLRTYSAAEHSLYY